MDNWDVITGMVGSVFLIIVMLFCFIRMVPEMFRKTDDRAISVTRWALFVAFFVATFFSIPGLAYQFLQWRGVPAEDLETLLSIVRATTAVSRWAIGISFLLIFTRKLKDRT